MSSKEFASVSSLLGHTIYYDPSEYRGNWLARQKGNVYPNSTKLWELAVSKNNWDLVLDIGSNYGEMLANVDLSRSKKIIAFEPNDGLRPFLERTISELPWDVELSPIALSSESLDNVEFTIDLKSSGTSTLNKSIAMQKDDSAKRIQLTSVRRLDDFLQDANVKNICVKLDIEGAEIDFLDGAQETLANSDCVVIMMEILHLPIPTISRIAETTPMFLLDLKSKKLIRVETTSPKRLGKLLFSGQVSNQDAIFVYGSKPDAILQELTAGSLKEPPQVQHDCSKVEKQLAEKNAQLDRIINSRGYQLLTRLRTIKKKLLGPRG